MERSQSLSIPGVQGWISAPTTYTMTYLNGQQTYTEPFTCIVGSPEWVATAGATIADVMGKLDAVLAAIPVIGPAVAGLVSIGSAWYGYASLNPDGSVTLEFASHYVGTKAGGVDVTAWPVPGVPPNTWFGILNDLRSGIHMLDGGFSAMDVPGAAQVNPKPVNGSSRQG